MVSHLTLKYEVKFWQNRASIMLMTRLITIRLHTAHVQTPPATCTNVHVHVLTLCSELSYIWYNNKSANKVTLVTSLDHLHSFSTEDNLEAGRGGRKGRRERGGGGEGGGRGREREREREREKISRHVYVCARISYRL